MLHFDGVLYDLDLLSGQSIWAVPIKLAYMASESCYIFGMGTFLNSNKSPCWTFPSCPSSEKSLSFSQLSCRCSPSQAWHCIQVASLHHPKVTQEHPQCVSITSYQYWHAGSGTPPQKWCMHTGRQHICTTSGWCWAHLEQWLLSKVVPFGAGFLAQGLVQGPLSLETQTKLGFPTHCPYLLHMELFLLSEAKYFLQAPQYQPKETWFWVLAVSKGSVRIIENRDVLKGDYQLPLKQHLPGKMPVLFYGVDLLHDPKSSRSDVFFLRSITVSTRGRIWHTLC